MRIERIEDLLRARPADEPVYRGELLLGPRMVPTARPDVRVRRPAAAALASVLVVVAVVVLGVAVVGPLAVTPNESPSAPASATASIPADETARTGVIPWIDVTPGPPPTPEPTPDPRTFPACTSDDV